VAPVGHPAPLRTVVDVDLAGFPVLWAGAGDHHTMFSATYDDLLRITAGEAAAVA
jgi:prolyl-tRNA editing enzyme YbaK/EbsC (Cys-tRNA(Pro) deacylase)